MNVLILVLQMRLTCGVTVLNKHANETVEKPFCRGLIGQITAQPARLGHKMWSREANLPPGGY
jgi:hypothetical protein